ncbi:unnamed protein product [Dicrocoelium dendriticum]|nr:unnamed protein product [Dicrocoelium dendriticum]
MHHNGSLFMSLLNRAPLISTTYTLEAEKQLLFYVVQSSDYPLQLWDDETRSRDNGSKKQAFIELPFKCEYMKTTANRTSASRKEVQRSRITFTCKHRTTTKTPMSKRCTSHCLYKFTCRCGDSYVGRTTRNLGVRI